MVSWHRRHGEISFSIAPHRAARILVGGVFREIFGTAADSQANAWKIASTRRAEKTEVFRKAFGTMEQPNCLVVVLRAFVLRELPAKEMIGCVLVIEVLKCGQEARQVLAKHIAILTVTAEFLLEKPGHACLRQVVPSDHLADPIGSILMQPPPAYLWCAVMPG